MLAVQGCKDSNLGWGRTDREASQQEQRCSVPSVGERWTMVDKVRGPEESHHIGP